MYLFPLFLLKQSRVFNHPPACVKRYSLSSVVVVLLCDQNLEAVFQPLVKSMAIYKQHVSFHLDSEPLKSIIAFRTSSSLVDQVPSSLLVWYEVFHGS